MRNSYICHRGFMRSEISVIVIINGRVYGCCNGKSRRHWESEAFSVDVLEF